MLTCSVQPNTVGSCQLLYCCSSFWTFCEENRPQEMIGCILSMEYFRRWCKSPIRSCSSHSIRGLKSCVPSPFYLTKYLEFFSGKLLWLKVELRSECNKSNSSCPAQLIVAKYQTTLVSFVCYSCNLSEPQTMLDNVGCWMRLSVYVQCKDAAECAA